MILNSYHIELGVDMLGHSVTGGEDEQVDVQIIALMGPDGARSHAGADEGAEIDREAVVGR